MFRTIPNRYLVVFAAVVAAQLLDLATFVPAVAKVGIGAETNPLARMLYQVAGPWGPAFLKAIVITVMLVALVRIVRRFPRLTVPSGVLVVMIGLLGAGSNLVFGLLS